MKAIEAYGALKEIRKETDQAKTALPEIKHLDSWQSHTPAIAEGRVFIVDGRLLTHLLGISASMKARDNVS